jgi:hypothetical protein
VGEKSKLRRTISKWANSSDQHARELRRDRRHSGDCAIADAPDREMCEVQGVLRTVTLRPRGGVPALEAELYDGSAVLTVIWLGRRQIAGIEPGRKMKVCARIGSADGHRLVYNPRYELLP